jgi:hypothetical protein
MANVLPLDIIAPGAKGLNTEHANVLLEPTWATVALNAVVNRSGRIAARRGWASQTTTAIASTPTIDVIFEYLDQQGTSVIITTAGNKIYKGLTDFTDAANDITSTTAPTADHWKFINFNGKVLGFQRGHTPIARSSGDFADASYTGTGPDGNTALAAFGRVWAADADLQTVRYSVLLDDTDYSTGNGGGVINMSSVWTNGMDEIVAIAAIGSNLVVFGKNHIVMWADGSGSELGIDPTALEVVDTIEGTGCIARDSVQNTGEGDLIFLSRHGVQSLGRVIQMKSNPIETLSRNVRTELGATIATNRASDAQLDAVRSTHSSEEGLYILNFPGTDEQWVFDTNHPFNDDEGREVFPITQWSLGGGIAGLCTLVDGKTYFGSAGIVGKYSGQDDNGSAYQFEYTSGWLDFGEYNHKLKMLKEMIASVTIGTASVAWTWEFDFSGTTLNRVVSYQGGGVAEFNVAEFSDGGGAGIGYVDPAIGATSGESEFSGSLVLTRKLIAAHGEGQFLRLGASASINGTDFIIQHMSLAPKIGRMVT